LSNRFATHSVIGFTNGSVAVCTAQETGDNQDTTHHQNIVANHLSVSHLSIILTQAAFISCHFSKMSD